MKTPDQDARMQADKPIVFISYAREDQDCAARLCKALEDRAVEVHGDWQLSAGEGYKHQLRLLILGADVLLFVITPDSVRSDACREELRIASEHGKRILPLAYRDVAEESLLPPPLREPQWIHLREESGGSQAVEAIVQAVNTDFELQPELRRLTLAADRWVTEGGIQSELLRGRALIRARRWRQAATSRIGKHPQPTKLISDYLAASERAHRRRVLLGRSGIAVLIVAFLALAVQLSNVIDYVHARFVSWTIDRTLVQSPDLARTLGARRGTEFYCTYFQAFADGRVFYLAETKAWVFPGPRSRQTLLLARREDAQGRPPWFLVEEPLQSLRDKGEYRKLFHETRKHEELNFPETLSLDQAYVEGLLSAPGFPPAGQYWVEGAIARVYATYRLDKYFARPFINECYSTLLLATYENGYVLGGAPVEHCRDVQGMYVLVKEDRPAGKPNRGYWLDQNTFPLVVGGLLKYPCEKGKGHEKW